MLIPGPCAPTLPTSKVTSILPAFSNISAAGIRSPSPKGALRPMNIRWLPPGASVTLAPGGMVSPPSMGRITMMPSRVVISWISILVAAGVAAEISLSAEAPRFLDGEVAAGDLRAFRRGPTPGLLDADVVSRRRRRRREQCD
jgi:hypothetical protein